MTESKSTALKLRILPGTRVWFSDATRAALLGPLPDGAGLADLPEAATVGVIVADDEAAVRAALSAYAVPLAAIGAFWVVYPKGNQTDLNRDSLWPILAEYGFRPISQVSVDATWSALRFRSPRPGEAPFGGG